MSTFKNREKAYENKFVHDEELRFKSMARRNKLLGEWAAGKLGFSGDKVASYAAEVVAADFDEPGDEDVFRKVFGDFQTAGTSVSEEEVREQMVALMGTAVEQIETES